MVKVSYGCMSNISSIIKLHNKGLLKRRTSENVCNCRTRENCPLQNQCLTPNVRYRADVENNTNKGTKISFGLAETSFKAWFANHNKNFNHEQYKEGTELSKYLWLLKKGQIMSRIRWSVVEKVYGRTNINFCPLYLAEKVHLIEYFNENRLLNKMNEFISGCRHQAELLLKILNGNEKTV